MAEPILVSLLLNSKPLMDKFYAKSIQGTAYLPGHEEENSESNDKKKDQD